MEYSIIALRDRQDLKERAANWFHSKWCVPVEAYLDSMSENDGNKAGVPQWYLALSPEGEILGGLGVSGGSAEQDTALSAYGKKVFEEYFS